MLAGIDDENFVENIVDHEERGRGLKNWKFHVRWVGYETDEDSGRSKLPWTLVIVKSILNSNWIENYARIDWEWGIFEKRNLFSPIAARFWIHLN